MPVEERFGRLARISQRPGERANLSTILGGHTLVLAEMLLGFVCEVDALAEVQHPDIRLSDTGDTTARTTPDQLFVLSHHASGCIASMEVGGDRPPSTPFTLPAPRLYAAGAFHIDQHVVELDTVANAALGAPGESIGSFALESAVDELAHTLGLDPIWLRRRNEPQTDPLKGTPFSARNLMMALDRGAERFGWERRNAISRSTREGEWWIGHGVASSYYPFGRMPGVKVSIRLDANGRATVQWAGQDMGVGLETAFAQMAAERLRLPIERVTAEHGDGNLPRGPSARGSAQTASMAAALLPASQELFGNLLDLAAKGSPLAGRKVDEVEARDGGLFDERYGRIINPSLAEYHVPVHADVPDFDVTWLHEPDPHATMGAKGLGEIGIPARRQPSPMPCSTPPAGASATFRSHRAG